MNFSFVHLHFRCYVGNIQALFISQNGSLDDVCFTAAENMTSFINSQDNGTIISAGSDPVLSFLTAGSSLEAEIGLATSEGGAQIVLPYLALQILATLMIVLLV